MRWSPKMDLPRAIAVLLIWLPTTHGAASDTIAGTTFAQTDFERQLNALSSRFLGRRYRLSPLGEGKGVDLDPLLRFDAFDCTTYIETVIALARSPEQNRDEQIRQLNLIRYSGGTPDFAARRHLPVFQWLPQLETAGILRDISVEIAPVQVRHIEAVI